MEILAFALCLTRWKIKRTISQNKYLLVARNRNLTVRVANNARPRFHAENATRKPVSLPQPSSYYLLDTVLRMSLSNACSVRTVAESTHQKPEEMGRKHNRVLH